MQIADAVDDIAAKIMDLPWARAGVTDDEGENNRHGDVQGVVEAALTAALAAASAPADAEVERVCKDLLDGIGSYTDMGRVSTRAGLIRDAVRLLRTLSANAKRSEKHCNNLYDSVISLRTNVSALLSHLAEVERERDAALARAEKAEAEARLNEGAGRTALSGYMRIVEAFDRDATAGQFMREDGEGGFASVVTRMAREIDRLREKCGEQPTRPDGWEEAEDEEIDAEIAARLAAATATPTEGGADA